MGGGVEFGRGNVLRSQSQSSSQARERRRAKRSGGMESGEEVRSISPKLLPKPFGLMLRGISILLIHCSGNKTHSWHKVIQGLS